MKNKLICWGNAFNSKSISGVLINVDLIAYVYIYLPILLFVVTWARWCFSIPVCVMVIYAVQSQVRDGSLRIRICRNNLPLIALSVLLIIVWLIICGMGSFTAQTSDYAKHNYILDQLTNNKWPVYCEYKGNKGMLTYYLGAYLVPSLVGKYIHYTNASRIMTLIYAVPGVALLFVYVYKSMKIASKKLFLLLILSFVFFDTFAYPLKDLFR